MNLPERDFVQDSINYRFKNIHLLEQAFTRKSYSAEHPEVQDNEVLEFYGDAALDFVVTRMLYAKFSKIVNNMFISEKNEGELTKLKSIIVSKESLARCMYNFGFSDFLYLGESDKKNEAQKSISVNEDLFEAIIGAVAVDSNWDYPVLEMVCRTMLQMETINNYLTVLVREKSLSLGFGEPCYKSKQNQTSNIEDLKQHSSFTNAYLGVNGFHTSKNPKTGKHEYGIQIGEHNFMGYGDGSYQAYLDADKKAYQFLCQEEIKHQFANIDYENPVSTLHELFQKKILMEVRYEFGEYHDENGNPIWNCKAILEGFDIFSADNISKKHAKQEAAAKLLNHITTNVIEEVSDNAMTSYSFTGKFAKLSDEEKEKLLKDFDNMWEQNNVYTKN